MHGGAPFVGLTFDADDAALTRRAREAAETLRGGWSSAPTGFARGCGRPPGIVAEPRAYGQTGVVANFACERAHRGMRAAVVPRRRQRARVAAAAGATHLDRLVGAGRAGAPSSSPCPPRRSPQRVAARGRRTRSGALTPISASAGFPLSMLRLPTTVAHRLALVGDAAHGVHPLAGPGGQPGLRRRAGAGAGPGRARADRDPGAPILLARYARRRVEPVLAMQAVTDGLARLFGRAVALAVGRAQRRHGRR